MGHGKRIMSDEPLGFVAGGGEMGALIRSHDWASSPLGPLDGWPQSLKTAVSICLNSRFPIPLWWGPDLRLLYNDAWRPVLGQTKHPQALGTPGREVWPEIWHIIGPMLEGVLATGQATWSDDQLLPLDRNGYLEEAYFTYSYSPIRDESGQVGGVFSAVNETTLRVIGERRLRTLRELAAQASTARTPDEAGRAALDTLAANASDVPFALLYFLDEVAREARLCGATPLEAGTPASPATVGLEPGPDAAAGWPIAEVAASGTPRIVDDLPGRFGDLPRGPLAVPTERAMVLPLHSAAQDRVAGVLVLGVNPCRELDDEHASFFDLVAGHVATALANAGAYAEERRRAEALAEIDRAKTAFFSNVSHEFRTPLTLMLGPVEDLLARAHTDLPPAAAGQLEVVNRNGLRLLRLVNTLLDFSRLEAGRVRAVYRPTDLAAFTADLASVFRSACERAGLRLVVDCPPLGDVAFVDRGMWEKVVLNLVSNAFKFTFDGEIEVRLRRAGDMAELVVRDTGTGIPTEEMPRLFERFHRVENARGRTHEGSGIGLALVQELVRLHGGTVSAESEVGAGSTFRVTVPFGTAHLPPDQIGEAAAAVASEGQATPYVEEALRWLPEPSAEGGASEALPAHHDTLPVPHPPPEAGDARPVVLVADDNSDMRQYIARLLSESFRVVAVPDGLAALEAARAAPPDLVLTDVMMPRMDGFRLLRELRADPRTSGLPILMLSARAGEESRVDGLQAGADDYLVKPFSARELLARVSAHVQMARMRREADRALRESELRYRLIGRAANDAIWDWDLVTDRVTWNEGMRRVFGYDPEEVGDQASWWLERIHQEDRDRVAAGIESAIRDGDETWSDEYRYRRADGDYAEVLDRGLVVRDGGRAVRMVGSMLDQTERKRLEHELRRVAADLSEANRRKDEFLATLAHELRNPLAPIRTGLQLMRAANADAATVERARSMMERQLAQLVRLVDDLMDVSRITRGSVELRRERVPLATVLASAIETSRPVIEPYGHELAVELPPEDLRVDADPVRLAQVFSNLLNNAARYTDPGGRIRLAAERTGAGATVTVADTGIGIPPDKLETIFEMFSQVDRQQARAQGGLGIGLTLVKRLVEMHGGTVEARSAGPGAGSEFVVRLPGAEDAAPAAGPSPADEVPERASPLRILVVDDSRDGADSLAMLLRMAGHDVRTAYDGEEGLAAAERFRPDVILLDIGLPKRNGYEACRAIRERPWGQQVVIVAMTGWGQEEDRRRSREAGFDRHLVKPVDPPALARLLAAVGPRRGGGETAAAS